MKRYFSSPVLFNEKLALQTITEKCQAIQKIQDLDPLIDRIGDARIVMLGEASHGTHEYYTWRAEISKRLIKKKDSILLQWRATGRIVTG